MLLTGIPSNNHKWLHFSQHNYTAYKPLGKSVFKKWSLSDKQYIYLRELHFYVVAQLKSSLWPLVVSSSMFSPTVPGGAYRKDQQCTRPLTTVVKVVVNRLEKLSSQVAMVAKCLDDNKPKTSHCFKHHGSYSISFNLSNVGEIFWGWIWKNCI